MNNVWNKSSIRADINVTPLVDVCLVLLIIFLVVTPLIHEGADVRLPDTQAPGKIPEESNQIVIAIRADGSLWLDATRVEKSDLVTRLKEIGQTGDRTNVVLRGDRTLPFASVREVMELTSSAGFPHAGLVTLKRGQGVGKVL